MRSATAEFALMRQKLSNDLSHLQGVRDAYYTNGKGAQLNNILNKPQLRDYQLENANLITVSKYGTPDDIEKDIRELSNLITVLKQLEDE